MTAIGSAAEITTTPSFESSYRSCYASPTALCYQAPKKRGRTTDAVFHAEHYKPLWSLADAVEFAAAWQDNPAWVFAGLAHAAFLTQSEIIAMIESFGGKAEFFEYQQRQGYLARWDDKVILAFRGTQVDEIHDIWDDLKINLVSFKGAKVHHGFHDATVELWQGANIFSALEHARSGLSPDNTDQIYVTGHSLGAAMAVVAGMLYPFKQIVTFGEPPVGKNIDAALPTTSHHIRYVNGKDNVSHAPLQLINYTHHGTEIAIVDKIYGPASWFSFSLINKDHSIVNYAIILRENIRI